MLRNFTLSNINKEKLLSKCEKSDGKLRILTKDYEDLLYSFIEDETMSAPIAYDLDSEYIDYIAVMLQKVKKIICSDIKELSYDYNECDLLLESILSSNILEKGSNDE